MLTSCFLSAGTSCSGLKYRGTVEVSNLSDENDMDDLDVSPRLPVPDHPIILITVFVTVSICVLIISITHPDLSVSV